MTKPTVLWARFFKIFNATQWLTELPNGVVFFRNSYIDHRTVVALAHQLAALAPGWVSL